MFHAAIDANTIANESLVDKYLIRDSSIGTNSSYNYCRKTIFK